MVYKTMWLNEVTQRVWTEKWKNWTTEHSNWVKDQPESLKSKKMFQGGKWLDWLNHK